MAIQIRGGSYENFDPNKMLPREPSVITSGYPDTSDGTAVMMSFGAGKTKRMATYEEMEENMENASGELVQKAVGQAVEDCNAAAERANAAAEKAENSSGALPDPQKYFGISPETDAKTPSRTVEIPGFELVNGAFVIVVFSADVDTAYVKLNVNGTGSHIIYDNQNTIAPMLLRKNIPYIFIFAAGCWYLPGNIKS